MSEHRPVNCHFRLQEEGKAYPKSGCQACGATITTGLGKECRYMRQPTPLASAISTVAQGKHTIEKPWGKLTYWKDGAACGCFDQWSYVEVHVWPNNLGVADMKFTRDQHELYERVDRALHKAFGHGKKARSKEFKALIEDIGYGV